MLSRSAGKPIFIGLSTAAILAAGAAQVQAAPGEPGEEEQLKPALELTLPASKTVKAGTPVEVAPSVKAINGTVKAVKVKDIKVTVSPSGASLQFSGSCLEGCTLDEELVKDEVAAVPVTNVKVSDAIKEKATVTVELTVVSELPEQKVATSSVTYTPLKTEPSPTPTKPKPTPTPTKSPDKGKDDDKKENGSGSGSSGSGSSSGGSSGSSGGSYTPPSPNGSFNPPTTAQSPQVALPPIATPSVAPQSQPTPESRLRNNKAPVAQDLTFERMASTQIAWLAALLVAFSLLLTQLRLGRRPATVRGRGQAAGAVTRTGRPKGEHRRPRKGLFSK
ncbi:hypothetical protein [Spirillospora sp. NPDC029432]|uniref:hypothetical protein n=1 Tax=Spirillospora sp. NPDC029432 TaxID=3154599 RepID=UPI0034559069